jgi:predicted nucleic acid-binding protein
MPFGVEAAKIYGVLASLLRATGRNPRPRRFDLQIAATAAAARLPLLTMNPDDFRGLTAMVDVVPIRRAG